MTSKAFLFCYGSWIFHNSCMLSGFSRVWLCDSMECNPSGSSVYGILHIRILEWVAVPSSRGSSRPRDQTCSFCIAGEFFTAGPLGKPLSLLLVAVIISWENRVLQCTILTHCGVTDFMKIMTWGPRCCWHMGRETERGFTSLKGTWCPQTHFSHWNAHRQLLSQSTELDNISYFHTHLLAGL